MPYISQITLPTGGSYDLKDAKVRALLGFKDYKAGDAYNKGDYLFYDNGFYIVNESITSTANTKFADVDTSTINSVGADILARYDEIKSLIAGGIHYIGYTKSTLTDGAKTNPITIDGGEEPDYQYTAKSGDLVIYVEKDASGDPQRAEQEFIFNGTHWNEFGSTGALKALAFADTASTSYTPTGNISLNIARDLADAEVTRENYTPAGSIVVTDPTITIASGATGNVTVVTGIKATGGTDTLNKVSAGTAVTVGKKAETPTTVGNANVGVEVTVATGLKTGTGYATIFTTNGIKGATIETTESGAEFNVPTNAISDVTLTSSATTSTGAVSYLEGTALKDKNTYTGYDTEFLNNVTVNDETLVIGKANVGLVNTTKYMTAPTTAALTQGYKVATTSSDTASVDVDTDTVNKVSTSTNTIFGVDGTETITPVTIGDSVTVIKDLDTTKLSATASNGGATFSGQTETNFKITSIKYNNVKDDSSATFTGNSATITVEPDPVQSGE